MHIVPKSWFSSCLFAGFLVALVGAPSWSAKTLMFMMDQYQTNLDTVVQVTRVYVPHWGDTGAAANGYYYSKSDLALVQTNAYAPPIPVNTNVSNDTFPDAFKVPKELERWWWMIPDYQAGSFRGGMMNVQIEARVQKHTRYTNPLRMQIDSGRISGQTGQINQSSSSQAGYIDRCIAAAKGDTVWFISKPNNQAGYTGESNLSCTDHNPFFETVGTVHVLNPWPGKQVWAQLGSTWYPLYADSGRQGWVAATLYTDPRNPQPFRIRLANGNPAKSTAVQYMDVGGLGANATGAAFDFTVAPGPKGEVWIVPPTTSTGKPSVATKAPAVVATLYIQRPKWDASSVRVGWQGYDYRFTPNATRYCGWFVMPLYEGAVPTKIVLTTPRGDTLYGAKGKAVVPSGWAAFPDWIDLANVVRDGGIWSINTDASAPLMVKGAPAAAEQCDTKVLAFSTYDYTDGKVAATRYAPFAEDSSGVVYLSGSNKGKSTDNCPNAGGGAAKGLVRKTLGAHGFPEWSGLVDCNIGTAEHSPQYWYDTLWRNSAGRITQTNEPGATQLNAFKCLRLPLTLDAAGQYYAFSSGNFFPLDTATSIPAPFRPGNNATNFHFAMHAKAAFEYVPGLKFEFSGDDDVWIFIDRKLVLDLGGMHSAVAGSIDLDALGLLEGRSYQFDMFYNERHTTGSSISIKTTMNLVPTLTVDFDTAAAGGKQVVTSWVTETTQDASRCIEEGATTTSTRRAGNPSYFLVSPDGVELQFDSLWASVNLPGVTISGNGQRFEIDTTALKNSGKLEMSGTYQIRIDLGTDSRSLSFTNVTPKVDVLGDLFDRDGDGAADSVALHAKGAAPAFASPVSATIRWADRAGMPDSVTLAASSLKGRDSVLEAVFTLAPSTRCPPSGCQSRAGTVVTRSLGVLVENPIVSLQDRMAPVADSAWMVYDTTGAGKDTLYVRASEGLAVFSGLLPAGDSAHVLAGRSAVSRPVPGKAILVGDLLKLPLDPSTNPVQPGDSVRLGGWTGDALGNAPRERSRWVPLRAEPVAKAWMLDVDGDGAPDSVVVSSRGSFATAVGAKVGWKTAAGLDTVVTLATPAGITGGLRLPGGILGGATWCDVCRIEIDLGGTVRTFALVDSVAPVALEAKLRFGTTVDTLLVLVSESFRLGADAGEGAAATKPVGSGSVAGTLVAGTSSVSGAELRIVVPSGTVTGDSLRLRGWVSDHLGKTVGNRSRFVKIDFGPQPVAVAVFDRDRDGRVDSVWYHLSRSSTGAPSPTGFGLVWGGATVSVGTLAPSADGMSWSGPVGPLPLRTVPAAGDRAWLAVGADTGSWRARVEDSVAPVVVAGALVFGFAEGEADTLRLTPSEPSTASSAGVVAVLAADSGAASGVSVGGANGSVSLLPTGEIQIVVASGAVPDGMGWVRFGGAVVDGVGNRVGGTSRWERLRLKPSGRAYLFDADGDGRADSMRVSVRGGLASSRAVLGWKTAGGAPDSRIWSVSPATGPFSAVAASPSERFEFGATSCTGCTVTFQDASGAVLVEWPLFDSVAPIALSGRYRFGSGRDTLSVVFSEAVVGGAATTPWLEWGNTAVGGAVVQTEVRASGKEAVFLLDPAQGAVSGWDSLRLAAGARAGNVVDAGGKGVGRTSPWAAIAYGIAPFQAWLLDPQGAGRGTAVRVSLARPVPAAAIAAVDSFRFAWTDAAGEALDERRVAVADLLWDGIGSWTGSLPDPFAVGRTGCSAGCSATGTTSTGDRGVASLGDSVPPTALRARLRYALPEVGLDTLRVTLSESWSGDDPADLVRALVQHGSSASPSDVLPIRGWSLGDGPTLSLVLDDDQSAAFGRGDSVRLAGSISGGRVADPAGNRVGARSRWVPVEFGLRPALLVVGPSRAKLVNSAAVGAGSVWDAPPATHPQIELLERRSDGSFVKLDASGGGVVGGEPVNDIDRCLGIDIRINRPLDGILIVYDNLGTVVATQDLGVLRALWDDQQDAERTIRVQWNATGSDHRFVGSGVYLVRVVARFRDDEGGNDLRNIIWKVGFQRDTK